MRAVFGRAIFVILAMLFAVGASAQRNAPVTNQSQRPVVAVAQLRDLANTGQGEAFLTMIQTAIVSSSRFRVIEREFSALNAEQNLANSGTVTTNRPGRRGGYEGVDFQIYGTITQAQSRGGNDVMCSILIGRTANCNRSRFALSIDIRITDQNTGQIRHAGTIREDVAATGDVPDYLSAFRNAAQRISNELTLSIYPIQVAAVQPDGTFILNYGADILSVGNVLKIYGASGAGCIINPANGECLTEDATELGQVRITETQPRFSRAVAVRPFATLPEAGANAQLIEAPAEDRNRRRRNN